MTTDKINKPDHYTVGGIQPIDVLKAKLTPEQYTGYLLGTAIVYLLRANHKKDFESDVKKAEWYTKRLAGGVTPGGISAGIDDFLRGFGKKEEAKEAPPPVASEEDFKPEYDGTEPVAAEDDEEHEGVAVKPFETTAIVLDGKKTRWRFSPLEESAFKADMQALSFEELVEKWQKTPAQIRKKIELMNDKANGTGRCAKPKAEEVVPDPPDAIGKAETALYAFEGAIVRLTQKDFDKWREEFPGIPLRECLKWCDEQCVKKKRYKWYMTVRKQVESYYLKSIGNKNYDPEFLPDF